MANLPESWVECNLADILYLKNGYAFQSSCYTNEGIPLIRISDIQNGEASTKKSVKIPQDKNKKEFYVEKGDMLIAMSGATTGKTGIYKEDSPCLQNQRVGNLKLHSNDLIEPQYRNFYISSIRSEIEKAAYGGAQPNISGKMIESFTIPIAPLNEQKRIVANLEKLLVRVETAQGRLETIPHVLKRFRQSVLMQAVTGELTKDWRKQNPAVECADKIYKKIQDRRDEYYKKLCIKAKLAGKTKPKNQMNNKKSRNIVSELPVIPESWNYFRLEDISHLVTDGTHQTPKYVEDGKPFLSVKNVRPFLIKDKDIKYITIEEFFEINNRCNPEKGDILYTKVGATFGYAAINILDYEFSIFVSLALIKPVYEYFISEYAEIAMNSELIFNQARERISGIGTPDLHLIEIRDFRIPFPPIEEQQEIVKRVKELFEKADRIEERYKKAKTFTDKLTQSILNKAFKGELVPQDPSDEPASVLLERIRAGTESSEKIGAGK